MTERINRLRIPVDDPEVPTTAEKALPVRAIEQEYAYISKLVCVCGTAGRIEVEGQALLQGPEGWMDQLNAQCAVCGRWYSLFFEVNALFEEYERLLGDRDDSEA